MAEYKHGIDTTRDSNVEESVEKASVAQVVIGTAPINLLDDPSSAVNKLVIIGKKSDMIEKLGTCTDYENYTLMQAYLAACKVGTFPIVMINVLDPSNPKHTTAVTEEDFKLEKGCVKLVKSGILLDTLVVKDGATEGKRGVDYEAAFDADGFVDIAVAEDGAFAGKESLKIAYAKLNPEGVEDKDIIGGTNEDGVRSGIDLADEVYPMFNIVPMFIGAPKYSAHPAVAAVLEAKAESVGDVVASQAFCDLTGAKKPEDVKSAKDKLGVFARHTVVCWPTYTIIAGNKIYASCEKMALMQYEMTKNNNVPKSIDNVKAMIDGVALEDGTEKLYTQKQMNDFVVAYGVSTFLYMNGWKSWGDTTAAYPDKTAPNDHSIKSVAIANWMENTFKTEYSTEIGKDLSPANIKSIVNNFNFWLAGLTPRYFAGGEIVFDESENPEDQVIEGNIVLLTSYADYPTLKHITNRFTWSKNYISKMITEITGGEG